MALSLTGAARRLTATDVLTGMNVYRALRFAVPALMMPLVAIASPAASAQAAAPPFAAAQLSCAQKISAVASGVIYGAGYCGGGTTLLVRAPGGAWRGLGVAWPNEHPEAVADDGATTFVVVSCTQSDKGCGFVDPLGKNFAIGKIPHGGRASALTQLGGTEFSGDVASVLASGGKWWAVWGSSVLDRDNPGSGRQVLAYRKTYGGAAHGEIIVPRDPSGARTFSRQPSLALTGAGALLAFVTKVDRADARPTLQVATVGADGRFTPSAYGPAAGASGESPDVAFSGGRTVIAWARSGRPTVALSQNGITQRVDLPYRGTVELGGLSVAASGGVVTVTTSQYFAYQGGNTIRVYAQSVDASGTLLATTELTAPAGRRDPHVFAGVTDSTAAHGLATVAFWDGTRQRSAAQ